MNLAHKKFIKSLMPFFGSTEEEVISHIIIIWATSNEGLSKIEEINNKLRSKPEKEDSRQEVKREETKEMPEIVQGSVDFRFRDCKEEVVITDSLSPITNGKTTYYLDEKTGLVRIERHGYPCAAHAYLADMLYLYGHANDVRKLLKPIDKNRRPIITGFLKDVPKESLDGAEKKDCPEKDCLNRSPEQCKFCTNKSRYESAKMRKTKEIREMAIRMGVK